MLFSWSTAVLEVYEGRMRYIDTEVCCKDTSTQEIMLEHNHTSYFYGDLGTKPNEILPSKIYIYTKIYKYTEICAVNLELDTEKFVLYICQVILLL